MLKKLVGAITAAVAFVATWFLLPVIAAVAFVMTVVTTLASACAWILFGAVAANAIVSLAVGLFRGDKNYQGNFFNSVGTGLAVILAGTILSPLLAFGGSTVIALGFAAAAARYAYNTIAGTTENKIEPLDTGAPITQNDTQERLFVKENDRASANTYNLAQEKRSYCTWLLGSKKPATTLSGLNADQDLASKNPNTRDTPSPT